MKTGKSWQDRIRREMKWTGFNVRPWAVNPVLAIRDVVRTAPVQYLAALLFIAASIGLLISLSTLVVVIAVMFQPGLKLSEWQISMTLFGASAIWVVVGPLLAWIRRPRGSPALLYVLRAVGTPARESIKAWDGLFLKFDRAVARVLTRPVAGLVRRPRRLVLLLVMTIIGIVIFSYGLLVPSQALAWGNQYGSGVRVVGGFGFSGLVLIGVVVTLAVIAFFLLIGYLWLRSVLAALPMIALYFLSTTPELEILFPYTKLVTYLPDGLAAAHEAGSDNWPGELFLYLSGAFIGVPGNPTTLGMILTGVLFGWFPYLLEQTAKPTPRERVAMHGWTASIHSMDKEQRFQRVKTAVWASALVGLLFGAPLAAVLATKEELSGAQIFVVGLIPAGIGAILLYRIIGNAKRNGHPRGDRAYRLEAAAPGASRAPDVGRAAVFVPTPSISPLARLLSEAERCRALERSNNPRPPKAQDMRYLRD